MTNPSSDWMWSSRDGQTDVETASRNRPSPQDVAVLAARCFRGADGEKLLGYLRSLTLDRVLGADADDRALRHLEGQRQLVLHLITLINRGRHVSASSSSLSDKG